MAKSIASRSALLLVSLFAATVASEAAAQSCGSILTASVQLTADIVCAPGQTGLIVAANNVEVDLNGHTISGSVTATWPTGLPSYNAGVYSWNMDAVTIKGPGRIEGFFHPIVIGYGTLHTIRGVTAVAGHPDGGTFLNGIALSLFEDNLFDRIGAYDDPRENQFLRNRFAASTYNAMLLWGCSYPGSPGATGNIVQDNTFANGWFGIMDGSDNVVRANRFKQAEVALYGAVATYVVSNVFENAPSYPVAVRLDDGDPVCGSAASSNNRIARNRINGGNYGVFAEASVPGNSSHAHDNRIMSNTFTDLVHAGLYFGSATASNDARGNSYVNVPVIVQDFGTGNVWP